MPYVWVTSLSRFRDTVTGRFIAQSTILDYADQSAAAGIDVIRDLADQMMGGSISPDEWREQFREQIKRESIRQYVLRRGGFEQMTARDWGRIGRYLRDQYGYLNNFHNDVLGESLSLEGIQYRSELYIHATRVMSEKGYAASFGLPTLPNYPGDGQTPCLIRCKCRLEIVRLSEGNFDVYWLLGSAEHCQGCVDLAAAWSPLAIRDGAIQDG